MEMATDGVTCRRCKSMQLNKMKGINRVVIHGANGQRNISEGKHHLAAANHIFGHWNSDKNKKN